MRTSQLTSRALVSLLLVVGLGSCDFLTTEPKGQLTTENFFKTSDQAVEATNATYNMLRMWQVHVFSWIGLTDIASDDATKGSTPGDAGFLLDIDNLNFDARNLAFSDPWAGYYKGIFRANIATENIPGVSMDPTLKARLMGENKFLRAYYYFFLVRAFGGVPLFTHPLKPTEYYQPRATATEVYDQIVQDLMDASASLPLKSQYASADLGRATKGAAQGMLAQVYLYRQDYAHALAYADSVINSGEYNINTDYNTIFTQAGENSSESVFEVQAAANPGSGCQPDEGCSNVQYAEVQGVRGTPNIGWGFNTPSPELEAAYEPGDPRLEVTILYPWEMIPDGSGRVVYLNPSMQNSRFSQKVFVSPDNPGGTFNAGINIRRLRYADVLLVAAEAAYRTSDEAKARTDLNQVRTRARGGHTVTLGFTPEQLATPIAETVLGLPAGGSRVFVRYAKPATAAYVAGLRSLKSHCGDAQAACASAAVPPIRVDTVDIIQTVDGSGVTTPQDYLAAVDTKTVGTPVSLGVLRVTQDSATGTVTTQSLTIPINAQALLPAVASSGQALLDAIWQERRVELAMEQQRWFDIRRQDAASPGRAAQLMLAAGKTFHVGRDELYPIPDGEVQSAKLQQNPGY